MRQVEKRQNWTQKYRQVIREYIEKEKARPCADCGNSFPTECMDFDHIRGVKSFKIGSNNTTSLEKVIKEIEKCEVVCANCHRTRTKNKNQYGSKK